MSYEDIKMANKMISDLTDSLRLNANTVMSLTTKLYAMHDAITALMDNSEEFEFDDGIGRGAQQRYWDEVNEAINEAAPPIPADKVLVDKELLRQISSSLGSFCGDEGWSQHDMDVMDNVDAIID